MWLFNSDFCLEEQLFLPPRGSQWAQVVQDIPWFMSRTSFPSSPRDIWKFVPPECLGLSWFIIREPVVEGIRGEFQRAFPEGTVESCLPLDAFQLRLLERRNISTERGQKRRGVMLICFRWLFQAAWHSGALICTGHRACFYRWSYFKYFLSSLDTSKYLCYKFTLCFLRCLDS